MELPSEVGRDESLHRAIHSDLWNDVLDRAVSGAFKNPEGLSVDRDGKRSFDAIKESLFFRHDRNKHRCIAYVSAGFCLDISAAVVADPVPEGANKNEFHALILDSPTKKELSDSKAKKIAKNCSYY